MLIFLTMLTPEVKTNLILKEFGVDRYIKRPSSKKNQQLVIAFTKTALF